MPERSDKAAEVATVTSADIDKELRELRKKGRLMETEVPRRLYTLLGCEKQKAGRIASCLIMLLRKIDMDILEKEAYLAVMGWLEGYDRLISVSERRKHFFLYNFGEAYEGKKSDDKVSYREELAIAQLAQWMTEPKNAKIVRAIYQLADDEPTLVKPRRSVERAIGAFERYINGERQISVVQSDYDYRSGVIPFSPRNNEFDQLDEFCADERAVLWWAIIGEGGAGKSRLAFEYMNTRKTNEWDILFLRDEFFGATAGNGKYTQFDNWSYPKNLLLIVDYAHRYPAEIAQWIESVYSHYPAKTIYKIRILILERSGADGLWFTDFANNRLVKGCQYRDQFLALQALNNDELKDFAINYAKARKKIITAADAELAVAALSRLDDKRRILYFVLSLDTFLEGRNKRFSKNKVELLELTVSREIRMIKSRLRNNTVAIKNYMQLLMVVTISTRISLTDIPELLVEKYENILEQYDDSSIAEKAIVALDHYLYPYTPDIIGEYFALTMLQSYFPLNKDVKWLFSYLWDNNPVEFSLFCERAFYDFRSEKEIINSSWLNKAIDGPIACNEASFSNYYLMIGMLLFHDYKTLTLPTESIVSRMKDVNNRFSSNDGGLVACLSLLWDVCQIVYRNVEVFIYLLDIAACFLKYMPHSIGVIGCCTKITINIIDIQLRRCGLDIKSYPYLEPARKYAEKTPGFEITEDYFAEQEHAIPIDDKIVNMALDLLQIECEMCKEIFM